MLIKPKIDYPAFLQAIRLCKDEVTFETDDGDLLNLKSILSEYIFVTITADPDFIMNGRLICKDNADYETLKEYLEPETE